MSDWTEASKISMQIGGLKHQGEITRSLTEQSKVLKTHYEELSKVMPPGGGSPNKHDTKKILKLISEATDPIEKLQETLSVAKAIVKSLTKKDKKAASAASSKGEP